MSTSGENLVDAQAKSRNRRLGIRHLSAAKHHWLVRCSGPVDTHQLRFGVDVPNHRSAGLEVVGALGGHQYLGRLAIVALASDLDSKRWWPFDEVHLIRG